MAPSLHPSNIEKSASPHPEWQLARSLRPSSEQYSSVASGFTVLRVRGLDSQVSMLSVNVGPDKLEVFTFDPQACVNTCENDGSK